MLKYSLIIFMFSALAISCLAQTQQDVIRQQEQIRKSQMLRELDSGVNYMDIGKYKLADEKFVYVLNNMRSVPSDLTFYFGKNSYYLAKYKQSIDWLNKYIQLKGTNGQFSNEAARLLKDAESAFVKEKSIAEVKKTEMVASNNYDIDCGSSGMVICPVCKGDHVIIKKGAFGDEYKTCPYCNEHGILTCQEYNNLLRGNLKPKF